MGVDVDEALALVGGCYPYHITVFILLGLTVCMPLCYQSINIVFIGYEPPHHCMVPFNQSINETIPYIINNGETVWDKCSMYQNLTLDNSTEPCTNGWSYDSEGYSTMVTEWDLVCEKNYLVELSQVIYQGCCMLGEITLCYLVDRLGRKPIVLVCSVVVGVTGTITAFSANYIMMAAMRGVTAVASTAVLLSGWALTLEMFDSKKRTFAGIGFEFPWLMVFLPMALFAWALPDWRHLQLFFSVLNFLSIIHLWILPESVPWLAATGKFEKGDAVLKQLAARNKIKLQSPVKLARDEDLGSTHSTEAPLNKVQEDGVFRPDTKAEEPSDVTVKEVLQLFKNRTLRKHSIISMVLWFVNTGVYYILTLVSPSLPGNRFVNFFILAAIEIPSYAFTLVVIKRYGRRVPLCFFHFAAGILLITMVFTPSHTSSGVDLSALLTTVMVLAKFAIAASFAIIVFYTIELFPTKLRGTAAGLINLAGKFGSLVAPVASYATKTGVAWLPSVLCSIASIIAGLLTLLLPETNNKPLPQTITDCAKLYDRPRPKWQLSEGKDEVDTSLNLARLNG